MRSSGGLARPVRADAPRNRSTADVARAGVTFGQARRCEVLRRRTRRSRRRLWNVRPKVSAPRCQTPRNHAVRAPGSTHATVRPAPVERPPQGVPPQGVRHLVIRHLVITSSSSRRRASRGSSASPRCQTDTLVITSSSSRGSASSGPSSGRAALWTPQRAPWRVPISMPRCPIPRCQTMSRGGGHLPPHPDWPSSTLDERECPQEAGVRQRGVRHLVMVVAAGQDASSSPSVREAPG